MDAFALFVINVHEVFYALLACFFCFFLYLDIKKMHDGLGLEKRHFLIPIFGVMLIGLTIHFLIEWNSVGLFLAPSFAALIMLSLVDPKYAISFFIYILLSRPWESFNNQMMESMPRDIFYLVVLSLLAHKFLKRKLYFRFNFSTLLILVFSLWVFLSSFFSQHQHDAIYFYLEVFTRCVIVFLLIQNGFEHKQDFLPAKAALMLAILEKSIISYFSTLSTGLKEEQLTEITEQVQRLESIGILGNSNDIAAFFVLAIPFCLFFILKTRLRPFSWLFGYSIIFLMSLLIWQSQSRGAMLSLVAMIGSYYFLKVKNKKHIILLVVFAVSTGLGALTLMSRKAEDVQGSTDNRIIFWKAGANMAVRNPVLGIGYWGFERNFERYAIDGNTGTEGTNMTAHSTWVQVVAENGFPGLILFASLWIYALYRAWLIRLTDPEYFMSLVGYGVAITFLSHAYLLFPYILLALAVTQSRIMFSWQTETTKKRSYYQNGVTA
jgi:putative inorganic carbon (hco3(-)) transporter